MTAPFKVIIVGGGPVGLTAAHALHHAGIDFVVLESRDSVALDQGASLVLGPHNLRVMHQFGILDQLLAIGGEIQQSKAFTHEGHRFKHTTAARIFRQNHGMAPVAFHRAQLIQTMYDGLPPTAAKEKKYHLSKKVTEIESNSTGVTVTCADGTTYSGSMILGADGVHSKTRRLMRELALATNPDREWDPEVPFAAQYRCMWCSFPRVTETGLGTETQNKDKSVMYLAGVERGWIFLYERLPAPTKERTNYTTEDVEAMAARFADYPITESKTVKDVFAERFTAGMANLEEGILQNWSYGRVVLVGDACHKYTPNAGLGLNNGIQDVVVLCNGLNKALKNAGEKPLEASVLGQIFDEYQKQREGPLRTDARQSASVTRMHAWANGLYYLAARYIMSMEWVESLALNTLVKNGMKKMWALDYVSVDEPFVGAVAWDHPLR
ncbi:FAD/NAD(P)-binding domain-containing protein [Aspergillus ellipticus CBS 707.79]|uniref:FAD/NAD(P)-binding domain-containing protein n=1 Tax=Aspergillus ellipticus CBS 707.79 TaxID=1448320 RepID=A0A319E2S2_9EURO|nr:FAD/NAD(P)-binding domain-containing protein [Aspergillus ellipticus CBS 707.79]